MAYCHDIHGINREILREELLAQDALLDAAMGIDLVRDEGVRYRAYKDSVGKWTIGCGRNLDDVGISAAETAQLHITVKSCRQKGITHAQMLVLLDNDIDRSQADLDRELPWWRNLDLVRQRVLNNMCFNMGIGSARRGTGLLGFKNTLGLVKRGLYSMAADNMLKSKWARQVHGRADRLAMLMREGPKDISKK